MRDKHKSEALKIKRHRGRKAAEGKSEEGRNEEEREREKKGEMKRKEKERKRKERAHKNVRKNNKKKEISASPAVSCSKAVADNNWRHVVLTTPAAGEKEAGYSTRPQLGVAAHNRQDAFTRCEHAHQYGGWGNIPLVTPSIPTVLSFR